jgi:H+/Cl- antiporter ClcA
VGYDVIDQLLIGRAGLSLIVGILVVKTLIWSLSLGSGTSGGVLAPVFMIGGALGTLEGNLLPHVFPRFWAMAGRAAVVGGVMRSPLTGIVFTLELTHASNALTPLLVASVSAYLLSALLLKRSVLTEKIARRGALPRLRCRGRHHRGHHPSRAARRRGPGTGQPHHRRTGPTAEDSGPGGPDAARGRQRLRRAR